MNLKAGDIVKFKEFLELGDESARFVVIEPRGETVLVEAICDLKIPPQSQYKINDLEIADGNSPILNW